MLNAAFIEHFRASVHRLAISPNALFDFHDSKRIWAIHYLAMLATGTTCIDDRFPLLRHSLPALISEIRIPRQGISSKISNSGTRCLKFSAVQWSVTCTGSARKRARVRIRIECACADPGVRIRTRLRNAYQFFIFISP
jgi:hypothetical protein